MTSIVVWAFFHSGGLKAGTRWQTASVPVIAEQPSAKARISRSRPNVSAGTWAGTTPVTCGASPSSGAQHPDADQEETLPRKM